MTKRLTPTEKERRALLRKQKTQLKRINKIISTMESQGYIFKQGYTNTIKSSSQKATLSQIRAQTKKLEKINKTALYGAVKAFQVPAQYKTEVMERVREEFETKSRKARYANEEKATLLHENKIIRGNKQAVETGKLVTARIRKAEKAKSEQQFETPEAYVFDDWLDELDSYMAEFGKISTTYERTSGIDQFGRGGGRFKRHDSSAIAGEVLRVYNAQRLQLSQNDAVAIKDMLVFNELNYRPRQNTFIRIARGLYKYLTGRSMNGVANIEDGEMPTIGTPYEEEE